MKYIFPFLLILFTFPGFGQDYPFANDFVNGTIIFKDSSQKTGLIKWFPAQDAKLKFKETENSETVKYKPEDLKGFSVGNYRFVTLCNFEACAENYPIFGKSSNIKQTFAQVLDTGKFNIYFVIITGYDGINGHLQSYENFLFKSTQDTLSKPVPYPFAIRMWQKKYDNAKQPLYTLFKNYPDIVTKLKAYRQEDDFFEIINMVKAINRNKE